MNAGTKLYAKACRRDIDICGAGHQMVVSAARTL